MADKNKNTAVAKATREGLPVKSPHTDSLPKEYRKAICFKVDGRKARIRGGRARLLDLLIEAGSIGVDRTMCILWCGDVSDTTRHLRNLHGVRIKTVIGKPTRFVLRSHARRDEGHDGNSI